jgi:3-oxoacyl-[acyl-carrier protein] reductase
MSKVALITGASKGIGAAIAARLIKDGIKVLTPSHTELDLASDKSVNSYLSSLKEDISILINNAGINPIAETLELTDKNIEETIRVNLISPIRLIRGIAPMMVKKGYGRIVNISSVWSVVAKPGRVAYAASKAGLDAVTRSAAVELAKHNILVNSIAPGFVNTELTKKNNSEAQIEQIKKQIPLGRMAETAEIAEFAAYLASERNTFITGQTIVMDGGYTCL